MPHRHSFSLLPDTSALGQVQGSLRWLAGLLVSHGAQAAKQAGSSHCFLEHGWSHRPTQIYDALSLAGTSQTPGITLALDQKQPEAGEAERPGLPLIKSLPWRGPAHLLLTVALPGGHCWCQPQLLQVPPDLFMGPGLLLCLLWPSPLGTLPWVTAPGYRTCLACRARSTWKFTPPKWPLAND